MDKKTDISKAAGHWVLARVGKKALRPGGKDLTLQMLQGLEISNNDDVVEFAAGLGYTAEIVNEKSPKTYTAVELNEEAAERLKGLFNKPNQSVVQASATAVPLPDESADKVYGEAMLTMQGFETKKKIVAEAARLLRKGGLYGIHEIALKREDITFVERKEIHRAMAQEVKVSVQPITTSEWEEVFEEAGFKIREIQYKPMIFLEPKQVIKDEGFLNALKIGFKMLLSPKAFRRIKGMRRTFMEHKDELHAICIIAEKV